MWRAGGGIKLSSENSQQQNIEYFRNNLRGRIQGNKNDLRLLFLEISKLEFLANACACRDLSSDCNFQVSFVSRLTDSRIDSKTDWSLACILMLVLPFEMNNFF